jgi:hypothetical protein
VKERQVTFTVLEDGMYLPSVGGVLPEGEYRGVIVNDDDRLIDVFIVLNGKVLAEMGVDRSGRTLRWSIINDYRSGVIREDRAS